jgi:hypothetical protein
VSYYEEQPRQIRIPFLARAVRAGDAVAGVTRAVGVKPCGKCKQRQIRWNKRVVFVPWRSR